LFKTFSGLMQSHLNFIMFRSHTSFFVIQMLLILIQVQPNQDFYINIRNTAFPPFVMPSLLDMIIDFKGNY
jgi:hypothetical protein